MSYEVNGQTSAGLMVSVTTPHFEELLESVKTLVAGIDGASTSEHAIPGIEIKSNDPEHRFIVLRTSRPPRTTSAGRLVEYSLEAYQPGRDDPQSSIIAIFWRFEVLELASGGRSD